MPRKSAASLSVIPSSLPSRPAAPAELTPRQAELWVRIVAEFPADYFIASTWPLLINYIRHVDTADTLAGVINEFDRSELETQEGLQRYGKLLEMAYKQSQTMAALSVKMRLSQSSRHRQEKRIAVVPSSKPWER